MIVKCFLCIETKSATMVQESIKLTFGTYTGEVKDGKPHGHGKCVFNSDDIQVSFGSL